MLSPLPKLPSNLDLVEARLLQHGPNGPEIDRPDPSLPAVPKQPEPPAEDTKLDPETIGFDPSFGEYDADGHSSLDKYLSGSLFGTFMKWITRDLWPQLEKYLGRGYDKLILQNLPPDEVNAHRDGQPSEKAPAAAMTPAENANVEGLSYDQQVFLGANLPNEIGQQLSADNTLLLKEFASFQEGLKAKNPDEIAVMRDRIAQHLDSLVAFVNNPDADMRTSLEYIKDKRAFFNSLKTEIDKGDIGSQAALARRLEAFNDNDNNQIPPMLAEQGKTLQTIIDAKNSDATTSQGNRSTLLLANYWLEKDFVLLNTLVPETAEPAKLSAKGTLEEFITAEYTDAAFNEFLRLNYERLLAIVQKDSNGTTLDQDKAYIAQLSALIYKELNNYPLPTEADFSKAIAELRKIEPKLGPEFMETVGIISRGAKLKLVEKIPKQKQAEQVALLSGLKGSTLVIPEVNAPWDPLGGEKLLRRSRDLFAYRHIIDNDKEINSSSLFANKLITEAEYKKLGKIDSDVTNLVTAISNNGFSIPAVSSALLNKYRNEIVTKLSSGTTLADKRVQVYYEQVLNYLDYAQAYVDRQPRVLFGKEFLDYLGNDIDNNINIQDHPQSFEYIDHLGAKRSGELVKENNGDFKLTLDPVTYTIAIKNKKEVGALYLKVDKDPATGTVWSGLDYISTNGKKINNNSFHLNEFIRVNGDVNQAAEIYKVNFGHYNITSDIPVEKPKTSQLSEEEAEQLIDLIEDQNFDLPVESEVHDIEIDNAKPQNGEITFDLVVDDSAAFSLDRTFGSGTIKKGGDGKFLLSVEAFGGKYGGINVDNKDALLNKIIDTTKYLLEQAWENPDTWMKNKNFNNKTEILGDEKDKFAKLNLDENKKTWTITLKDKNKTQIPVGEVKVTKPEDQTKLKGQKDSIHLVTSIIINKENTLVIGLIPRPTDIHGYIDRTDALKKAANWLVIHYNSEKNKPNK